MYDTFWPEFTERWRREKGFGPEALPEDYYVEPHAGMDLVRLKERYGRKLAFSLREIPRPYPAMRGGGKVG